MSAVGFYIYFGFIWLFTWLPIRIQYIFSDVMYFFGYYLLRYRKKTTLKNLRNAFPEKSEKEIHKIARKFYRHLFDLFIESMASMHISKKEINKRVKFKNIELLEKYYNEKRNLSVVGGHYGNWEWNFNANDYIPYKILAIYKKLSNKYFNTLYNNIRSRFGCEPVEMKKILRRMMEYRQKEVLTITYFLGDQRPLKKNIRHWLTFLNQDTPVYLGPEKISIRLDQPVVYMHIHKLKRGYYEAEFIDLVKDPKETKEYEITQKIMETLEKFIRKHPEYWLWSHNRWKFNKPDSE